MTNGEHLYNYRKDTEANIKSLTGSDIREGVFYFAKDTGKWFYGSPNSTKILGPIALGPSPNPDNDLDLDDGMLYISVRDSDVADNIGLVGGGDQTLQDLLDVLATAANQIPLTITADKVLFGGSSDNITYETNFHWNSTSKRLGVNVSNPSNTLHVGGDVRINTLSTYSGATELITHQSNVIKKKKISDIKLTEFDDTGFDTIIPANEIVYGTGTGITSDAGLKWNVTGILSVDGLLNVEGRLNVDGQDELMRYSGNPFIIVDGFSSGVGLDAASGNTGAYVTATGTQSAQLNEGNYVTATGTQSAQLNEGNYVTATGTQSAYQNTGDNVTAMGYQSAQGNTGNNVTASGYRAARENTKFWNIAIGHEAMRGNTSYENVILIGNKRSGAHEVAPTANNQVVIGSSVQNHFIQGKLGIKEDTPLADFHNAGTSIFEDDVTFNSVAQDNTITKITGIDGNGKQVYRDVSSIGGSPTITENQIGYGDSNNELTSDNGFYRIEDSSATHIAPRGGVRVVDSGTQVRTSIFYNGGGYTSQGGFATFSLATVMTGQTAPLDIGSILESVAQNEDPRKPTYKAMYHINMISSRVSADGNSRSIEEYNFTAALTMVGGTPSWSILGAVGGSPVVHYENPPGSYETHKIGAALGGTALIITLVNFSKTPPFSTTMCSLTFKVSQIYYDYVV